MFHVPIMFHMPCIKEKKIEKLADLSDIAPTVLGIADIEIPTSYIGNDLTSDSGHKNYIQMEVFHRGNCLFEKNHFIWLCVQRHTSTSGKSGRI